MPDGTKIFCEQTSHHPPVTHMLFEGPEGLYRVDGHTGFHARAWFNSMTLDVHGKKRIVFRDGQTIEWNNQGVGGA